MNANYLVVVGVDGSEGGPRALDWAAREADSRGGGVVQAAVAGSWDGIEFGPIAATDPEQARQRAGDLLDREIKELARRRGSHLPIAAEVIEGRPADVLAAAGSS